MWVGVRVRVRVRVRSGVGLVWAAQPTVGLCGPAHKGAATHKSLLNSRANLKNLAHACNFAGGWQHTEEGFSISKYIIGCVLYISISSPLCYKALQG